MLLSKEKRTYVRVSTIAGHVLVDDFVAADLRKAHLSICCATKIEYPIVVDGNGTPVHLLHLYVDDCYVRSNFLPPRPADFEIHHESNALGHSNKLDARGHHLHRLSRQAHGKLTRSEQKKKKCRSRALRVEGVFRPRAPGRVSTPAHLIGMVAPRSSPSGENSKDNLSLHSEDALEVALQHQLKHLRDRARDEAPESHAVIPSETKRERWRRHDVRSLGLKQTNRAPTPGECALVFALILNQFDRERAAAELGVSRNEVDDVVSRVPVAIAIERWLAYRRYPKPSPHALKLRLGSDRARAILAAYGSGRDTDDKITPFPIRKLGPA